MKTLIYDENEVKRFYDEVISVPGVRGYFDTDFFCVAARKKYMTEEERQATRLGDTVMMEKTVLKKEDFEVFSNKLHKVDAGLDWLTSNNGTKIPRECMVFYMNVNHTNMVDALKSFKIDMSVLENELLDCLVKEGSLENISYKIKSLNNVLLKAYQNPSNMSKRNWVDIDLDVSPENISGEDIKVCLDKMLSSHYRYEELKKPEEAVVNNEVIKTFAYKVINTRGGYHILVSSPSLSYYNSNYSKQMQLEGGNFDKKNILSVESFTTALNEMLVDKGIEAKELKINQNAMVPIPGTLQGGVPVKIIV